MKILRLQIQNFRGIQALDWHPVGQFHCLIGPGDSSKSTILDAIEFVHSPRWNLVLDDSDFFQANVANPILIESTICEFPDDWLKDEKFGLDLRGWGPEGLVDEPLDEHVKALTIQMKVDSTLEPTWHIVNDRNPDGHVISAKDRERLGIFRLGNSPEFHLSWSRSSILTRLNTGADDLAKLLADVSRAAIEAVTPEKLPSLQATSSDVQKAAKLVGFEPKEDLRPLLDMKAIAIGSGAIALHDGKIPVRRAGLGSRRLLTMAVQRELSVDGGLCLVDEIEHGLEPHRLRRLLRVLRGKDSPQNRTTCGQSFVTSHAPVALSELKASELFVVRNHLGVATVKQVPQVLQPVVRTTTEAFLARKVIVCEGMTELGFLRGIDNHLWDEKGTSFGLKAVALADGKGCTKGPTMAKDFAELGYEVLYFGDSDRPLSIPESELVAKGIKVVLWADNTAFENRLALDLPWEGILSLLRQATSYFKVNLIRDSVATDLGLEPRILSIDFNTWLENGAACGKTEEDFRSAIGNAANAGEWFKQVDRAEPLANIVREHQALLTTKDTGTKIKVIVDWAGLDG